MSSGPQLDHSAEAVNITALRPRTEKAISAADASRNFSRLLTESPRRPLLVVTTHEQPVARISPVQSKPGKVGDSPGWGRWLRGLRERPVLNIGRSTRDERGMNFTTNGGLRWATPIQLPPMVHDKPADTFISAQTHCLSVNPLSTACCFAISACTPCRA